MFLDPAIPIDKGHFQSLITWSYPVMLALIAGFGSWVKDLNAQARRMRDLDEAKKQVDFWDAWMKTAGAAGMTPDLSKIREEISFIAKAIETSQGKNRPLPFDSHWKRLPAYRRWLFLLKPPSFGLLLLQIMFYIGLLNLPSEIYEAFGHGIMGRPDVVRSPFMIGVHTAFAVGMVAIYYLLARFWVNMARAKSVVMSEKTSGAQSAETAL